MDIFKTVDQKTWDPVCDEVMTSEVTHSLEEGRVVFLPNLEFELKPEEKVLLSPDCSDGKAKNISFNVQTEKLGGASPNEVQNQLLKSMMGRFAHSAIGLMKALFPAYSKDLKVARTSYRPVEILGRKAPSYKKDDTRLHVDAFPSTPNQGHRILRLFANINPEGTPRVWRLGEPFESVAKTFLPQIGKPILPAWLLKKLYVTKSLRTDYDHIMLNIHNKMKADMKYQSEVSQEKVEIPAGSTWIVATDLVSHAVLSGQYVLEQTFHLPVEGMADPQLSPLRILERLTGRKLV